MTETIQLLTITTEKGKIGMDSTEVERALMDSEHTDTIMIETAKRENRFYSLGRLLDPGDSQTEESYLVIRPEEERTLIVAFSGAVDFVKVGISRILAVPPYIRRKQNPLFVWGFVREKERLVTLVTFGFLSSGGAV